MAYPETPVAADVGVDWRLQMAARGAAISLKGC